MPNKRDRSGEQEAAEGDVESFRKDLGPYVVAAETTRMAMVFTDAKASGNPIIFANDSFLRLTGYPREEVLGQNFNFLMARGAGSNALASIEEAFQGGNSAGDPEICYRRKDDTVFWATVFVSPVHDGHGDIVQHFASFVDTTRHKKEEDRLRFLLDELNHRTQNTLATVLAIAKQTLGGVAGDQIVAAFQARILALSKAQSLLGSASWDRVGMRHLVDRILEPFGLHDVRMNRFKVGGADVRLRPKAALFLAMVFHELATNSVKYGALSNEAGQIDMTWQVEEAPDGDRMRLIWKESGGPPVSPPVRKGFGSRLIERGLAQELDGEVRLEYDPAGVSCTIAMPVPQGDGWTSHE